MFFYFKDFSINLRNKTVFIKKRTHKFTCPAVSTIVNEVIRTISSPFVFFKEKFKMYKKHQNVKQTISTLLEVFVHKINCSPVVFCSLIFVLLVEFCLKNGLEIVMITSFAILLTCTLLTHHS